MSIAFSFHNDVLTLIAKGKVYNVRTDDERYRAVKEALKNNDEDAIVVAMDTKQVVSNYIATKTGGRASFVDGQVYIDGTIVNNVVAERVKEFAKQGLPFEHLLLFLDNVRKNPSYRAQEELFKFLENKYLPITEDGCFYAYKSVRNDWKDFYSGTIDNHIGNEISMERNTVDDNKDRHCSKGLHCGAIDYVNGYGGHDKHIIIVKVNPADVVSVPTDCSCQKVRVCKYICWAEYQQPLTKPLYQDQIDYNDDYDDDWEDDWDDLDDDYENEEDNDWQDDYVTSNDVCVKCGYHNKRDNKGRFCK